MDLTINSRHVTVPDSLRNQAEQRLARMEKLDRRITGATLVFSGEANVRRVEARMLLAGAPPLVGSGDGPTLRNAMDRALSRLERQLKDRHDRRVRGRTRGATRSGSVDALEP